MALFVRCTPEPTGWQCLRSIYFSPSSSPHELPTGGAVLTHTVGLTAGHGCARQISKPSSSPASSQSAPLRTHRPALSPVPDPALPPRAAPPGPLSPSLMGQARSQGLQARAACPSQFSVRPWSTNTLFKNPRHSYTPDVPVLRDSAFPEETETHAQSGHR